MKHKPHLSPRQLEILRLVAKGETNKSIAAMLSIRGGTVAVHMRMTMKSIGAKSRAHAVSIMNL